MPKQGDVKEIWYLINAKGQTIGDIASNAATLLRGKNQPTYTPHLDPKQHVVVINAKEIRVTGNKASGKLYRHHTGFMGGVKSISLEQMLEKNPAQTIELAVKGMLPLNKWRVTFQNRLHVYPGAEHTQSAQQPVEYKLRDKVASSTK